MMKIFLSHSVAPEDGPVASRLKAVAAAYGISVLLPDRAGVGPARKLGTEAVKLIRSADVLVALVTERATQTDWVMAEIQTAEAAGRPIVALVEDGVHFEGDSASVPLHIVRFDRDAPGSYEPELVAALTALRKQAEARKASQSVRANTNTRKAVVLGAFAGIAIGLLALGAVALTLPTDEEASA